MTSPSRRYGGAKGGERPVFHERRHGGDAASRSPFAGDVAVRRARLLERQADEFAAALDARPVEELVRHGVS